LNFLKQFSIPFAGLKNGEHQFEFEINKLFFDEFEYSPIKEGSLFVKIDFNKQENMFVTGFHIHGTVNLICDRCNEPFDMSIDTEEELIFKLGEEAFDNSDEVIVIGHKEHEINLANFIYEFINLAVPIIHIHPDTENNEPGCNKETLEALKKLSVNNDDPDSTKEIVQDPRWDALKKLRDN
jgi:uncharacterized protein